MDLEIVFKKIKKPVKESQAQFFKYLASFEGRPY